MRSEAMWREERKYYNKHLILSIYSSVVAREDKGEREGIPHTHPVP